jgi:pilus assembly protein Flp/PilA
MMRARIATMGLLQHGRKAAFWSDTRGATSIEYAMIAAGIAVAIVSAVQALGTTVTSLFTSVQSAFH